MTLLLSGRSNRLHRLFRTLMLPLLLAASILASSGTAHAATGVTTLCSSTTYSCLAGTGYTGQSVWGSWGPGHNCVSYAAYRLSQTGPKPWTGNIGNGSDWDEKARGVGIPVDTTPAVGSIAQWDGGDGHVAYVEVVTATYIDVSEDNYLSDTSGYSSRRRLARTGTTFQSAEFIHIRDTPAVPVVQHSYGKTDFTHDGISDYTIYSGGTWAVKSGTGSNPYYAQGVQLGGAADTPFVADFNSDGTPDFAIYAGGTWAVKSGLHPNPHLAQGVVFGGPDSTPLVGDFNGDGAADFAIYSGGQWAARSGVAPNPYIFQGLWLGSSSSTPMAGDIDGNGITDIVIYENGTWAAKSGQTPNGYLAQGVTLGGPGSAPLLADLDGDNRDDYIIYSAGTWAVKSAAHPNPYLAQGVTLGGQGSIGLTGDFNADNRADYTIYSTGTWAVKSGIHPNPYLQQGVQLGGPGSLAITG